MADREEGRRAMERAAIVLKAVSCRDLALPFALFGKPPVYAVVSLGDGTGRPRRQQPQSTPFDRSGGCNPEWDQELRFDLAGEGGSLSLFLEFEFVARWGVGGVLGDRVVGKARIPLRDLAEEYAAATGGGGGFRSVTYQVRSLDSKPAGDVTFRYRVRSQHQEIKPPPPVPASPVKQSPCYYPPPPPAPAPAEEACVVQQPRAVYYYCCPPAPPPPPPVPYGHPMAGYDFAGRGYVESWAPPPPPLPLPPPAAEPCGFPWKGCELAGRGSGHLWGAEGGAYPAPMYGSASRFS